MSPYPGSYLSRFRLDLSCSTARKAFANVEVMHKTTCALVDSDRASSRLLWRWEPALHPTALVQAAICPSPERLPHGFAMTDPTIDMAAHLAALASGQAIRYRLTASPTRDLRINGRNHKKRVGLPASDIPGWWQRNAVRSGIEVTEEAGLSITMGSASLNGARIPVARIDGYGQIIDADALRHKMLEGIGRAKAYGCGLLTVQRLHPER